MSFNFQLLIVMTISSSTSSFVNLHEATRNELHDLLCDNNQTTFCNVDTIGDDFAIPETYGVYLLCRSNTFISFEWPQQTLDDRVFVVEVKEAGRDWDFHEKTQTNRTTIVNLSEDVRYQLRVWTVNSRSRTIEEVTLSNETNTFGRDEVPHDLRAVDISRRFADDREETILSWAPGDDRPCIYEVLLFDIGGDEVLDVNVAETGKFETPLDSIDPNAYYTVFVMARSERDRNEGNKTEIRLQPACLEANVDRPACRSNVFGMPDGLHTESAKGSGDGLYDVKVSWTRSNRSLTPDYYIAELIVHLEYDNFTRIELNVSSDANAVTFANVRLLRKYEIYLFGVLDGVRSEPAIAMNYVQDTKGARANSNALWMIVSPILLVLIGFGGTMLYLVIMRRNKETSAGIIDDLQMIKSVQMKEDEVRGDGNKVTFAKRHSDKWEIDSSRLSIGNLLGNGAFGIVKKGWLRMEDGSYEEVAIKTLNDNSTEEDKKQFLAEIEIMKSVGVHRHLVSFVGCNTVDHLPILIVEYCARGDLKTYLQNAWNVLTDLNSKQPLGDEYENLNGDVANKLYDFDAVHLPKPVELVSFARQVSVGMEYLSSLRVLHRDLAARNVLICADGIVKVSDFGLSRDVYRDNVYCKSTGGKLPIRWMAIESLTHQIYTSQSDVWSYGILLWEIVTLGANPYPGVSTHELLTLLDTGYRMDKPDGCNDQLYNLMSDCWLRNPKDRPTFTAIKNKLDHIMEDASHYLLLDAYDGKTNGENFYANEKAIKDDDDEHRRDERYVQP